MKRTLKIFVVEDSLTMKNAIIKHIEKEFGDKVVIHEFSSVEEVLNERDELPDIMFLDHHLQKSKGVDSITTILKVFPQLEIAVISGQNDIKVFTNAYQKGASDYIRKDALFFHQISSFINSYFEKEESMA